MKTEQIEPVVKTFESYSVEEPRRIEPARERDPELGPLKLLPGTWANVRLDHRREDPDGSRNPFFGDGSLNGTGQSPLDGRGWNIIALPFFRGQNQPPYRVLMNQYNEVLHFAHIDDKVPNRGIDFGAGQNTDQEVAALDYTQHIRQLAVEDDANSGKAFDPELDIHHEPGFFLHMKKQTIDDFSIARLATIPHGNVATAVGKFVEIDGPPTIPPLSAMPEGVSTNDVVNAMNGDAAEPGKAATVGYLAPYKHYVDSPFMGVLGAPFPGFHPLDANHLIRIGVEAIADKVKKTTELVLDTDTMEAGIVNIPFIERQADAALMRSTFWIMELDEESAYGEPRLVLAYSQFIFLDFFPRRDGREGFIRWPHVSINMMEKISTDIV